MTIQNALNLVGLIINMIGVFMMFHHTPKVSSQVFLYTDVEASRNHLKDVHNNRMIRRGMLLLLIGFLLQFSALLIGG